MISKSTSLILLKRIDEYLILSYPHLRPEDELYYLGEFTPREPAGHSDTNQLIRNYKKESSRRNHPDWPYKERDIKKAAGHFYFSISQTPDISMRMDHAALVPIPPSEAKASPEYDDRNLRLLQYLAPRGNICELILQKKSRPSLRSLKIRDPKKLEENYYLDAAKLNPATNEIWLFDDVLTQGTTFRAASDIIKKSFPHLKIVGFFIARSVYTEKS